MWRVVGTLCVLTARAAAQPGASDPAQRPPAITAEPAPPSSTPPVAYPPPPTSTLPVYPMSYEAPRQRADRFLLALGAVVGGGGEPTGWLYGGYTGELGVTLLADPLRVRPRAFGVLYGGTMESDWNGDFSRIGAGLEGRWCTGGLVTCLFGDLDVGYQKLTLDDDSGSFVRSDKGVIAGPRFGIDFGGTLRLRFALEAYRHFAHHTTTRDSSFDAFGTIGLSLAVGYQI
jgi:hypothetical protein